MLQVWCTETVFHAVNSLSMTFVHLVQLTNAAGMMSYVGIDTLSLLPYNSHVRYNPRSIDTLVNPWAECSCSPHTADTHFLPSQS